VITKITDVTYKINCGRKGKPQVIHVDMIRKILDRLAENFAKIVSGHNISSVGA
jgi:hypothetical protein